MRAYFVSDLHLPTGDDDRTRTFIRFLEFLRDAKATNAASTPPTHLFLVGDIFDFWIADHVFFQDRFRAVINVIRELIAQGIEVHYFEGNHDLHLAEFWQHNVGGFVHADHAYFEIAGHQIRVEHGDLINPDDKGYLFLRRFLRTRVMEALAFHLPHSIVRRIGERASRASRKYTSHSKGLPQDEIRAMIRAHAKRVYKEKPFDLIISGHVHVSDDETFIAGGKQIRSINLGSWFDGAKALVIDEGRVAWLTIDPSGAATVP